MRVLTFDKERCLGPDTCDCTLEQIGSNWMLRIMGDGYVHVSEPKYMREKLNILWAIQQCPSKALALEMLGAS